MSNAIEFSVSELSSALKRMVEDAFGHVRLRGEISGYRGPHGSGHAYFALKDDKARIEAVIWRGIMSKLRFKPEEGLEVVVTGKLTTYPGSSKYQIVIETLEPAGAGALMALLEERRLRLREEGLFDVARKKPLPFIPRVIGVITSPTGAVIRDILHRLNSRFPSHVLLWPVRVQGENCSQEVVAAIEGFNDLVVHHATKASTIASPDVLIVARGGGSLEDLWEFNDEAVVRAVAASHLPVISAIGHETDWTLLDHVADVRAPTPTAAAEMVVPVRLELAADIAALHARLNSVAMRAMGERQNRLHSLARILPSADQILANTRRRFDEVVRRFGIALTHVVEKKRSHFEVRGWRISLLPLQRSLQRHQEHLLECHGRVWHAASRLLSHKQHLFRQGARVLETVNYKNVLDRGFVLVLNKENRPLKQAANVPTGEKLTLRFADGDVAVTVRDDTKKKKYSFAKQFKKTDKNLQGNLF